MQTTLEDIAIATAESVESHKAAKARKRAEKLAKRAKLHGELSAKLAAGDVKLAESSALLRQQSVDMRSFIDDMVAEAFLPASPAKILAALTDTAFVGRITRFDVVRLQAAYCQGLIRATIAERRAIIDPDDTDRSKKIREAVEDCKLAAAKSLGIHRKLSSKQSADDLKKLSARSREYVTRLSQAGKLFERFGWLRTMAETSNRELGAICTYTLAPFAAFSTKLGGTWTVVHPLRQASQDDKAKRNGDKQALTPDEETKLRGIVQAFADGSTTEKEMQAALVLAGLRKAPAKRKASTDGAIDETDGEESDGKPDASGKGAPQTVDYVALGLNASAADAKAFIVSWFNENAGKDKATAVGILIALQAIKV